MRGLAAGPAVAAAAPVVVAGVVVLVASRVRADRAASSRRAPVAAVAAPAAGIAPRGPTVELSSEQVDALTIAPVGTDTFTATKDELGSIAFDEDRAVQVFPPYPGRILATFAELGENVSQGRPLYSIQSPDLIQAENGLIAAAAALRLTTRELARARALSQPNGGVSERELEQAVSDQQTAQGALSAARDAVRVFGKSDTEMDSVIATRTVDPALIVRSPIGGQVTARDAQPGTFVQPGTAPAPYAVADLSTKWMLADVPEGDIPLFHLGDPVAVTVLAWPGRVFAGRVSKTYAAVDPTTHRVAIRSEIADPADLLRPGMLADFVIRVHAPALSTAVPVDAVVREGDGTMTAWVTADRRHFTQRVVTLGLQQDGRDQILSGLAPG